MALSATYGRPKHNRTRHEPLHRWTEAGQQWLAILPWLLPGVRLPEGPTVCPKPPCLLHLPLGHLSIRSGPLTKSTFASAGLSYRCRPSHRWRIALHALLAHRQKNPWLLAVVGRLLLVAATATAWPKASLGTTGLLQPCAVLWPCGGDDVNH